MSTTKRKNTPTVSFEKLSLFKELDTGKKAKLSWGIRGIYPRITVFTNTKETDNAYDNLIIAPMDGQMFYTILSVMRRSIKLKDTTLVSIECLNKKWVDNLPTDEVYVQATINIRYTGKGFIELSLTAEDKDEVVFTIGEHLWHTLNKGSSLLNTEFAELVTGGYIQELENVFTKVYVNKQTDASKTYGGDTNKKAEIKVTADVVSIEGSSKLVDIDESDIDKIIEDNRAVNG